MTNSLSSPHLQSLPFWLSRWLGYRPSTPPKLSHYEIYLWSFIGSFCGLVLIQAVFEYSLYFVTRGVPPIIASYGAGAVLIYGAIEAPLAQPYALIGGQFLGALIGICITKLFHLLPTEEMFQKLLWICGSLACSSSIVVMQITGTMHPPGGATALLAAISPEARQLGWYYLPVILLSSTLALAVALIVNNIRRQYPLYWFRPCQLEEDNEIDVNTERSSSESRSEKREGRVGHGV
ncbi:HPP family domain containing protein [Amanita muscaria]